MWRKSNLDLFLKGEECRPKLRITPAVLTELKGVVGAAAVKALQRGAHLCVWRCSTPHNWYIEHPHKKGHFYWHSDGQSRRPDRRYFRLVCHSDRYVVQYWGSDSGLPEKSTYRLAGRWPKAKARKTAASRSRR